MFNQTNEKGKFFTEIINKEPVEVIIQTTTHRIHGKLFIRPQERIKEELNQSEIFLALTDVIVFNPQNEVLYQVKFMALNREQIVWLFPKAEIVDNRI